MAGATGGRGHGYTCPLAPAPRGQLHLNTILYTLYSILYTLYSILYTLYSMLYSLYSILNTPSSLLNSIHCSCSSPITLREGHHGGRISGERHHLRPLSSILMYKRSLSYYIVQCHFVSISVLPLTTLTLSLLYFLVSWL